MRLDDPPNIPTEEPKQTIQSTPNSPPLPSLGSLTNSKFYDKYLEDFQSKSQYCDCAMCRAGDE